MVQEKQYRPLNGWIPLIVCLGLLVGGPLGIFYLVSTHGEPPIWQILLAALMIPAGVIMLFGFQAVAPNDARALLCLALMSAQSSNPVFFG